MEGVAQRTFAYLDARQNRKQAESKEMRRKQQHSSGDGDRLRDVEVIGSDDDMDLKPAGKACQVIDGYVSTSEGVDYHWTFCGGGLC
jgi:hypothetical protein